MSVNEELEEHVQHVQNRFDKIIAASMALVAALLAVVSVFGQHYNTEELLMQQKSSDQWAFFQAKDIRRYTAMATSDLLKASSAHPSTEKYDKDAERYNSERAEIQKEAQQFASESKEAGHRAQQFHNGEIFLELSIVLLSLSILTKRRPLAFVGFGSAVTGVVWAATGFLH